MLLKLLKYDFRAMWKRFSLIWGAALALALVNRFTLFRRIDEYNIIARSNATLIAFCCVIMAMLVITIGFVVNRFSKGLLGSEGYLMHTLPVRAWQLVLSKLICGAATWMLSGMVALAALLLMVTWDWSFLVESGFLPELIRAIPQNFDTVMLILEFCLLPVSVIIQTISAIYLAVSVGHLVNRRRGLVSIAAFIGLYVLLSKVYDLAFSVGLTRQLMDMAAANVYGRLLAVMIIMLIPAAVFLAAVCWILDHKLNLE